MNNTITIVVPVYGRSELLEDALKSIEIQDKESLRLIIADDGSDNVTKTCISEWMGKNKDIETIWIKREKNIGLFKNLNKAITANYSPWYLLLCSDDILAPNAIKQIKAMINNWEECDLIISTYESIGPNQEILPNDDSWHHDKISKTTKRFNEGRLNKYLLKLGSINGNLTGMLFSHQCWVKTGQFKAEWTHAADWEWMLRAVDTNIVLLSREMIAMVRTHEKQLSNTNRRSGNEIKEVTLLIKHMLKDKQIHRERLKYFWAAKILQMQMWNTIKNCRNASIKRTTSELEMIDEIMPLPLVILALLLWMPVRLTIWLNNGSRIN